MISSNQIRNIIAVFVLLGAACASGVDDGGTPAGSAGVPAASGASSQSGSSSSTSAGAPSTSASGAPASSGGMTGSSAGRPASGGAPSISGGPGVGGEMSAGTGSGMGGRPSVGGAGGRPAVGGASMGGAAGSGTAGSASGGGGNVPPGNPATPSAGCGKTPTIKSGANTINGRQYTIRLPSDYDNKKPYRLIFGMHWLGGSMQDVDTGQTVLRNVWSYYGLQQLDTQHTSIFVAPQGNNCGTWCKADEQFVKDMVTAFEADLCIDTSRIFSVGFSYGAIFSYSLGCDLPDIFRGVATLEAAQNIGCTNGNKPVAYLGIEGLQDPTCTPTMARACRDTFVTRNQCMKPASVPEWTSGQNHVCYSYEGCTQGYPVRWCTGNFQHKAATCDACSPGQDDGNKTWEPGEVWKFFTQF